MHLTILHQNVQEIQNKIERLVHLIETADPDVVILTEHGLKSESIKNTRIPGYMQKSDFSRAQCRKGGVVMYVKEEYERDTEPISVSQYCQEVTCEMAMIKISQRKEILYIVGIYRSPNGKLGDALDIISTVMEETKSENFPVIMMGDINVDILKPQDRDTQILNERLNSHNLSRLQLPPTRITPYSSTSIDCICTNLDNDKITTSVLNAGLSDHTAQIATVEFRKCSTAPNGLLQRQLKQSNINTLRALLENEDWESMYNATNIDDAYNNFLTRLTLNMDAACPVVIAKAKQRKKRKTFLDEEALNLKAIYLRCLSNYHCTGTYQDKAATAEAKKNYDCRLKMLRQRSSAEFIEKSKNKSKAVWHVINTQRSDNKQKNEQLKLNVDGEETSDPQKIADHLNQFFTGIADQTLKLNCKQTKTMPIQQGPVNQPLTNFIETNQEEILSIINSLKPKTSAGVDGVSSKLIKECHAPLIAPLVFITNLSLRSGKFPTALKLAKVYPKLKSGNTKQASNYRPISLISTFAKVIERVVLQRLLNHCEHNKLLTKSQHGFLKGRSTTTAITDLAEYIIDHLEAGNLVTGIMLDFSKAFDCLGHDLILNKLDSLGVTGYAHSWFRSYLEQRHQLVELRCVDKGLVQTVRSKPLSISRGVPQGSILGPVMFILFTNDLPKQLEGLCHTLMYADDTTLLATGITTDELAVKAYIALNVAYQYCHANDLVVNMSKTSQLAFGRRRNQVSALPDLDLTSEGKFLGVTIDEKLSWTQHVDILCKKLNTSLYIMKRIKAITDLATTKTTYYALFESHIRYGLAIWGGTTQENLKRILLLQKRAVRILHALGPRDTCREAFKELKIKTVVSLYIQEVIVHVDEKNLPRVADLQSYPMRNSADYLLPAHHLTMYEKKPSYAGKRLFNLLPTQLKLLRGKQLKTSLSNWLLTRPFYTLDEYLHWT